MLDLMIYSLTIDRRMQEMRSVGTRRDPDQDETQPARRTRRPRPTTDRWPSRIVRVRGGAVDGITST